MQSLDIIVQLSPRLPTPILLSAFVRTCSYSLERLALVVAFNVSRTTVILTCGVRSPLVGFRPSNFSMQISSMPVGISIVHAGITISN